MADTNSSLPGLGDDENEKAEFFAAVRNVFTWKEVASRLEGARAR